jgi:hypothetical protein
MSGDTYIAFSGGKDSTALALRWWLDGKQAGLLFTPTGNELPECLQHIREMQLLTGFKLITPPNKGLDFYIRQFNALPNWRQRWCTRAIKIQPCIDFLKLHPGSTLLVGLRADEEHREGIYGDYATYRSPLREWGWGLADVIRFNESCGVKVPARTDCALCYGQRISEWHALWRDHPEEWKKGEEYEAETGHTFRSAQRDTWPAAMKDMRAEFEGGRKPRRVRLTQLEQQPCRVCRF